MRFLKPLIILIISMFSNELCSQDLGIMTYNIRYATEADGENAWSNRKEKVIDQILFHHPDVLGVQEATHSQMKVLNESLSNYTSFGLGRDGGQNGEHSSIFFNKNKLSVLQKGTFWLSETPDKLSTGWDASLPRICTYGLFTLNNSDKKFWVFNTHLDHIGREARKNSLVLILDKIRELNIDNKLVVLMGDFNLEPKSEAMVLTLNEISDAKDLAEVIHGPEATFTGFDTTKPAEKRIDYILLKNTDNIIVNGHATFAEIEDQRYPSDHFPVMVKLHFD